MRTERDDDTVIVRSPLPSRLRESAEAWANSGAPVEPRDAATVMLLRDGAEGVEAYFLRRQRSMAFAAGMYVFPGGGVDPRDADASLNWLGPPPSAWAQRLGCGESTARELVCAAVRETFEEAGVLLAGDADGVVADTTADDWEADRAALEAHELSFAEFLSRRGLALRSDLLAAWSHWITPVFEPRRYDTRFFVAAMPKGQRTRDVAGEADHVEWSPVRTALARADAGEIALMPPTRITCAELAELPAATDAPSVADARRIVPIVPRLVDDGDDFYLETELP